MRAWMRLCDGCTARSGGTVLGCVRSECHIAIAKAPNRQRMEIPMWCTWRESVWSICACTGTCWLWSLYNGTPMNVRSFSSDLYRSPRTAKSCSKTSADQCDALHEKQRSALRVPDRWIRCHCSGGAHTGGSSGRSRYTAGTRPTHTAECWSCGTPGQAAQVIVPPFIRTPPIRTHAATCSMQRSLLVRRVSVVCIVTQ